MMPYDEQLNGMPYPATDLPASPQMTDDTKSLDNECGSDKANQHSSTNSEDVSFIFRISI